MNVQFKEFMPKGGRRRRRHVRYRRLVQAARVVSATNVIVTSVDVLKLRWQRLRLLDVVPFVEVVITTSVVVQPCLTVSGPLFVHFVQLVDALFKRR